MARTIADQLVALGLVTTEHAEEVRNQAAAENPKETVKVIRSHKVKKVSGDPITRICVACGNEYQYIRRSQYPGKSPKRCPKCQLQLQTSVTSNTEKRPKGHKTRQQHKRVRVAKK